MEDKKESSKIAVIFFGPPGCGKGSSSTYIREELKYGHISTGDLLRNIVKSNSSLGQKIKELIEHGHLVDDDIILSLVDKYLKENLTLSGFILDGFPRTVAQAQKLDKLLKKYYINLKCVFKFNVSYEILIKRAVGRLVHLPSGRIYHNINHPPAKPMKDDVTGEDLVYREDDNEETIKNRLTVYEKEAIPIVEYYQKNSIFIEIVDANQNMDLVIKTVGKKIEELI